MLDFSENAAPIEEPVKIGKKDYVLKEASADAVMQFKLLAMKDVQPDYADSKARPKVITSGLLECDTLLVSKCLFEAKPDGGHGPVQSMRRASFHRVANLLSADSSFLQSLRRTRNDPCHSRPGWPALALPPGLAATASFVSAAINSRTSASSFLPALGRSSCAFRFR